MELHNANCELICNESSLLTKILCKRLRYHLQERILDEKNETIGVYDGPLATYHGYLHV